MPDDQSSQPPQPEVPQTDTPGADTPTPFAPSEDTSPVAPEVSTPTESPTDSSFGTPAEAPAAFSSQSTPAAESTPSAQPFGESSSLQPEPTPPSPFGEPAPAGQPPVAPTPTPTPSPKGRLGLIIGIVIGVLMLVGGGVAAAMLLTNNKDANNNSNTTSQEDKTSDNDTSAPANVNAKTAGTLSDFKAVCDNGSISNAAALATPYTIVAFDKEDGSQSWSTTTLKYNAPYAADYEEFEKVNVVTCLTEDASTRVKAKTCDFKSNDQPISVDYYSTSYNVTAYEASTGEKIKDLGTVNGPAGSCPMFATFNRNDPKVIANPDDDALNVILTEFAG